MVLGPPVFGGHNLFPLTEPMSNLYVVSTPIGNLADITQRALEVLGRVSRILAEDTRHTRKLLTRYSIKVPLLSLHAHNEAARSRQVLSMLGEGEELALVSNAGTPMVSDPGARIVSDVIDSGYPVVPVPGASALLAALVASGLDPEPFSFFGFVPRKGRDRDKRLKQAGSMPHTVVLYESPNRLLRLLHDLEVVCGSERRVVVAREMTKVHETFVRGTLAEVLSCYQQEEPRGELVVLVAGKPASSGELADSQVESAKELAERLLSEGRPPSQVARQLVKELEMPRNMAYRLSLSKARGQAAEKDEA